MPEGVKQTTSERAEKDVFAVSRWAHSSGEGTAKNATRQENHLWYDFLRGYPVRFQRQKTIGRFIADFYCHAAKRIIEVDGSQHGTEQGLARDRERTAYLEKYG